LGIQLCVGNFLKCRSDASEDKSLRGLHFTLQHSMRNSDASADDNSTESFLQIRHFDWLCRRIQEFLSCGDGSFRLVLKEGMWNRKTPNYVVGDTVFQTLWNGGAYNAKHNWCPILFTQPALWVDQPAFRKTFIRGRGEPRNLVYIMLDRLSSFNVVSRMITNDHSTT
jgi:hypothetical protein